MDSDKFDSLLDLEDFSDIYASIYGDTDKDNTEATEQQPKTEYNNAATADKTASGADELFSMTSDAPDRSAEKPAVEEKKPQEPEENNVVEEAAYETEVAADTELAAVITAAVYSYLNESGEMPVNGILVRSIKRAKRAL